MGLARILGSNTHLSNTMPGVCAGSIVQTIADLHRQSLPFSHSPCLPSYQYCTVAPFYMRQTAIICWHNAALPSMLAVEWKHHRNHAQACSHLVQMPDPVAHGCTCVKTASHMTAAGLGMPRHRLFSNLYGMLWTFDWQSMCWSLAHLTTKRQKLSWGTRYDSHKIRLINFTYAILQSYGAGCYMALPAMPSMC